MNDILILSGVTKTYQSGKVIALKNLSFSLKKGQIATIVGSSGSGKSTLLRLISGLEVPNTGMISLKNVVLNNDNIFIAPEKRNCSLVFQNYALFPNMTVEQNIYFGKYSNKNNDLVKSLIDITRIEKLQNRYPHEISGGQQQRVALVRALANNPSLLLMDEPLSDLDQELRNNVRLDLKQLIKDLGTTTLIVSHDTEDALAISDKIIVLKNGKLVQEGSPKNVYNSPISKYVALLFGKSNFIPEKSFPKTSKIISLKVGNGKFISIRPGQLKIVNQNENQNSDFLAEGYIIAECVLGVFKQLTVDCKVFVVDVNVFNLEDYKVGEKVGVAIDHNFFSRI